MREIPNQIIVIASLGVRSIEDSQNLACKKRGKRVFQNREDFVKTIDEKTLSLVFLKKNRMGVHLQLDVKFLLFAKMFKEFGTIDIMVSNAGIQIDADFVNMTLKQWQRVIDVNLTGGFLCAKEAAGEFIRRGVVQGKSICAGKIIFISSVHEVIPWARHANYAASKGGIMLLMKSIAQELAPHKIRVNSIGPGAIKTPINVDAWSTPEAEKNLLTLIPYKRVGEPQDIATVAVWLASDESDYVNGTTIIVDGGMTLYPGFATGG